MTQDKVNVDKVPIYEWEIFNLRQVKKINLDYLYNIDNEL